MAKRTKMAITLLGCGTSVGAPMIGLQHLPQFRHPRNHRLRASCLVEPFGRGGPALVIDLSPDFREQALRYFPRKNPRLDAILLTHSHADHIHGLDDIRPFNFRQQAAIPLYSEPHVLEDVRIKFSYIFQHTQEGGGKPRLHLHPVLDRPFHPEGALERVEVIPLPLQHGRISCLGFRIGSFAYITDCSYIPDATLAKLKGLELLVLDCLRPKPHTTHLNAAQSIDYARRIRAKKTVFTHMGFELEYEAFRKELPRGMAPGYDGMQFRLPEPHG
ncbi:MAG: MBL fold metallo-hydrolase [Bdellovibrionales bacterium]|nr:MBL fold metallo-hydrolase [Bdellovibrionales bacterium]